MQSIAPLSMDLRDSLAQASLPLRWVLNAISDPFSITFLGGGLRVVRNAIQDRSPEILFRSSGPFA